MLDPLASDLTMIRALPRLVRLARAFEEVLSFAGSQLHGPVTEGDVSWILIWSDDVGRATGFS